MNEHYLIIHKVRGEPAFDVAEKLIVNDEEWWIIPTSGHRAYPFIAWPMDDLPKNGFAPVSEYPLPDGWPDHFQAVDAPARKGTGMKIDLTTILSKLAPKIKRRI